LVGFRFHHQAGVGKIRTDKITALFGKFEGKGPEDFKVHWTE
jgi:hypothetical protein